MVFLLLLCAAGAAMGYAQVPQYTILTVAGNNTKGYAGDGAAANQAELSNPCKVAVDNAGNLYIADQTNHRIRKVSGANINTVAGNGTNGYTGDGKPPTQANISYPCGVAVNAEGNIYFSQSDPSGTNDAIREAPASGNMSTVAGTTKGAGFSGDGGKATNAQVNRPTGLALDSAGNLYIADTLNNRIRQVRTDGTIVTVAGDGSPQYRGDGGPAFRASLNGPQGVAVDSAGNLYIADTLNHVVRKVSGGFMYTIAGNHLAGFSGDNGPATKAQLNYPEDVAVDSAGNVYIADTYNFRIRMVSPDGTITTIAGGSRSGYSGDNGLATNARLNFPSGVAVASNGAVYVADTQNNVIRLLAPVGSGIGQPTANPPVITSVVTASQCGDFSSAAPGAWVEIYGTNLATNTRNWNDGDFQGNAGPVSLDGTQVSIGGQSAVVSYISPRQVNAQVPLSVPLGAQQLTLSAPNGSSVPFAITINAAQPGLCQGFQVGGNPYVTAVVNDTTTYILPAGASFGGVTSRPARPGEVISLFGIGFGAVTPSPPQGQVVQQLNELTLPLEIFFGQTQVTIEYAGLAPGYIGVYQFNVVVPDIPDSDLVPVTFALGDFAGAPTLYTAVRH